MALLYKICDGSRYARIDNDCLAIECGGIRGAAFIKKSYIPRDASGFIDTIVETSGWWYEGILRDAIEANPRTRGTFDGGKSLSAPGYGRVEEITSRKRYTAVINDASHKGNCLYYGQLSSSRCEYHFAFITETELRISDSPVSIDVSDAIDEDIESLVLWALEVSWTQDKLTVQTFDARGLRDVFEAIEGDSSTSFTAEWSDYLCELSLEPVRKSLTSGGLFLTADGKSLTCTMEEYVYNGMSAGTKYTVTNLMTGKVMPWSLLDSFNTYPMLTEEVFQKMSVYEKMLRRDNFLYYLGGLYGMGNITELNEYIMESDDCEAYIEYVFTVSETLVQFGVDGGVVELEVVSTANSKAAAYSFIWDGGDLGDLGDNGLEIVQTSAGLRVVASDTAVAINGVIRLEQARRKEAAGVLEVEVRKLGSVLYAGGRDVSGPPENESEVKSLSTQSPVNEASPFVLYNPAKGGRFEFSAPAGSMTVCIVVPASLGSIQKALSLEPKYDMTSLFELSPTQVVVDGITCNVYYYMGLVAFAGAMRLRVDI